MPAIGRRKRVHRYGVAHGIRLTETMRYVVQQYANQQQITFSDAIRLLLEMAISQRVNAVEAQQAQLDRIEAGVNEIQRLAQAALGDRPEGTKAQMRESIDAIARIARGEMLPGEINEALGLVDDRTPEQLAEDGDDTWPDGTSYDPPEPVVVQKANYYAGTGWEF